MDVILSLILPFIGTSLGAVMVFFVRNKLNKSLQKILMGFAAGVMLAASVFSLIIPAIEESSYLGKFSFIPASVGFGIGIIFLLILDTIIPHLHRNSQSPEGVKTTLSKSAMMMLAVTLHNIPEGLAVGVVIAGALSGDTSISMTSSLVLAIGIAVQNFPEGAIISIPLKEGGASKKKAFIYGVLSGAAELISAILAIFISSLVTPILPYILAFAAGAMIYVIVEEIIPELQDEEHSNLPIIFVAAGFILMMALDVALG